MKHRVQSAVNMKTRKTTE